MPGLNGRKLREVRVPLPPLKTQLAIVARLDNVHSAIAQMHALSGEMDLAALRESILREAFAGNL